MHLFGESFLFIALAVGVFLCASVVEIFGVIEQFIKCKVTENAIAYLEKNRRGQRAVLKHEEVDKDSKGQVWEWLKKHIAGSVESNDKYKPSLQNNRFVLLEYPYVLAQS